MVNYINHCFNINKILQLKFIESTINIVLTLTHNPWIQHNVDIVQIQPFILKETTKWKLLINL